MRTIKFRAWDRRAQEWYDKIIEWIFDRQSGSIGQLPELNKYIELMKFTGLLDKNGKEIYEGDIIHNDQSKLLHYPLIVCWHYEMSSYVLKKSIHSHEFIQICEIHSPGQIEVIGNIYENPELLSNK